MTIIITRAAWGYEARLTGRHGDDIAAAIAKTRQAALIELWRTASDLPRGNRRDAAVAAICEFILAE